MAQKNLRRKNRKFNGYEDVYNTAIEAFGYDKDKAIKWYTTPLPAHGKTPFELCKEGKANMLLKELSRFLVV